MLNDETKREWFAHALQRIHHPVCLVDAHNRFVWCNAAYEKLVGYSESELLGRTWMSITDNEDVGGDLAAVDSIISGERDTYTTQKEYEKKSGETTKVALTVWRFPMSGKLIGFSVEAVPEGDLAAMQRVYEGHIIEIQELRSRIERMETFHSVIEEMPSFVLRWLPLIAAISAAAAWIYSTLGGKN